MVRCILSKFYIKPQLYNFWIKAHNCCILSKFYIKPQHSHETYCAYHSCILSKFYIKPQLFYADLSKVRRCILSKFYIKPQHPRLFELSRLVVSYRNSTSNHNLEEKYHNLRQVVSYRNSTSNHNSASMPSASGPLYLIEILHQTTTKAVLSLSTIGCILSKFYIKPQLKLAFKIGVKSCILSKFYIKPQQRSSSMAISAVVSYRNSTSNHNWSCCRLRALFVVSYRNSTSNHNSWRWW